MGIPHLIQHLSPHCTKAVFARQRDGADGGAGAASAVTTKVIIDGPALAYHSFYFCLSRRAGARNAIEATPSYHELGAAAIAWLEQIECYGLRVDSIFFDGLLPESKVPERLSRLQKYANQLVAFRSQHRDALPPRAAELYAHKSDVLGVAASPTKLKALPAPTFLVPAVIEAIQASRYAAVTGVVPGEADAYCAHAARDAGGVVFTSDSDLLVHDLGPEGTVVLFNDIESIHMPTKGKCLRVQQYHPAGIAGKFGLPDLVKFAFFMSQDPHRAFRDGVRLAKENLSMPPEFSEFREQYGALPVLSKLGKEQRGFADDACSALLSRLDPRLSELIHQVSLPDGKNTASAIEQSTLDIYLPFLLDDPTRTSAWRAGATVRTLAYSLLRLLNPALQSISEYERKGIRIAATSLPLLQLTQITRAVQDFVSDTQAATRRDDREDALPDVTKWRVLAARLVVQSCIETGKTTPSASDLSRLVLGTQIGAMEWPFIHAHAQMQAALYSLRVLLQVTQVVQALLTHTCSSPQRRKPAVDGAVALLAQLSAALEHLPSLMELLDDDDVSSEANKPSLTTLMPSSVANVAETVVADMLRASGVDVPETEEATTTATGSATGIASTDRQQPQRKKKRKQKTEHTASTRRSPPGAAAAWRGGNMFSNLVD